LARALRLTISGRIDARLRHDSDLPLTDTPVPRRPRLRAVPSGTNGQNERRFEDLLEQERARENSVFAHGQNASLAATERADELHFIT
jgi:hypothetical protein